MFQSWHQVYDNFVDPWIPELWARESLAILEENMIAAMMVHRDFENEVRQFGDIVNTRRPGEFEAIRKTNADPVTKQAIQTTNVQVPLNQHVHTSFIVKDGEQSKSFVDLVSTYIKPAMLAQAQFIDRVVLGQYAHFVNNSFGSLGGLTKENGLEAILGVRNIMNVNKAYVDNRNLVLSPNTETVLLALDLFTHADKIGDDGTALREASLGRKLGFNMWMSQNMSSVPAGIATVSGTVNGAHLRGATTVAVSGFSAAIPNGSWIIFGGDGSPQQVVSSVGGASPTSVTITPGLKRNVETGATATRYVPGTINNALGYATGYAKEISVSGFTAPLSIGQFVTFGTASGEASSRYTVIGTNGLTGITLDRPLDSGLTDGTSVNPGPSGEYNWAFHRNAVALVVRPLELPMPGAGARAAVINRNDFSMRAVITYNGEAQGHLVTLDMLCGIAILDHNLGAVLLG